MARPISKRIFLRESEKERLKKAYELMAKSSGLEDYMGELLIHELNGILRDKGIDPKRYQANAGLINRAKILGLM